MNIKTYKVICVILNVICGLLFACVYALYEKTNKIKNEEFELEAYTLIYNIGYKKGTANPTYEHAKFVEDSLYFVDLLNNMPK